MRLHSARDPRGVRKEKLFRFSLAENKSHSEDGHNCKCRARADSQSAAATCGLARRCLGSRRRCYSRCSCACCRCCNGERGNSFRLNRPLALCAFLVLCTFNAFGRFPVDYPVSGVVCGDISLFSA